MFKGILTNRVIYAAIAVAAFYVIMRAIVGLDDLIILLNGAFIGAGLTYIIAFSDILKDAVVGRGPYDRVRQMALGMIIVWVAVTLGIASSIYGRASGAYIVTSEITPISRYLAIVGGVVQITAPDIGYGQGFFFGRDRRLLLFGLVTGIVAAIAVIILQT